MLRDVAMVKSIGKGISMLRDVAQKKPETIRRNDQETCERLGPDRRLLNIKS